MVAVKTAPSPYVQQYLKPPFFDYLGKYRSVSGYNSNPPIKNPIILKWMQEESISCDEYTMAKGNTRTAFNAINKYAANSPNYDPVLFGKAVQMLRHSWSVVPKSSLAAEFTEWMDLTTSPGYPYSLIYKNKKDALADPEVREYCEEKVRNADVNGIWTNRCKKEPKKKIKVYSFDSRVITACPMDVSAVGATLFGPMNENIYQTAKRHQIPCTVGLSKYYRGWDQLYARLLRNGKNAKGLELDYTGFDGSCTIEEMTMVMNLRYGLLHSQLQTPAMKRAFQNYYRDVIHTKILMDTGDLVMKHTGNPSGQPNTIVDNSLINEFRWYYAWCSIVPEEYHNLQSFREHCELLTCGDDSLLSGDEFAEHLLTPERIFQTFSEMGWKPKFASQVWQPVHTLSYCSQHFFYLNGHVVPVPNNVEKLVASLLYGGQNRTVRETLGRLLGVKIESYFLTNFRCALDHLITHLFTDYYFELRSPAPPREFSYEELLMLNRDYSSAYGLYLGLDDITLPHTRSGPAKLFSNDHINDIKW